MNKNISLALASIFILFSSVSQAKPTIVGGVYPDTDAAEYQAESIPTPNLGYGYSHDNDQPIGGLIAVNSGGLPIVSGKNTGVVDASTHYDLDTIMEQLRLSAEGHFSYKVFSGGAEATFAHALEQDNLTESFIYRTNMKFKDLTFVLPTNSSYLTPNALALWNQSGSTAFKNTFGNAFISQMNFGAYLYVSLQFHFLSQRDKYTFDTAIKGSDVLNVNSFKTTLNYVFEHNKIQGEMHILGIQEGGQPQYLSDIVADNGGVCGFKDYKNCDNLLTSLVSYLKTGGDKPNPRLHFPDQFTSTVEGGIPNNAANTDYNVIDYSKLGFNTTSQLTNDTIQARDMLGETLMDNYSQLQRANFLLKTIDKIPYAYDTYKFSLKKTITQLKDNISNLKHGGDVCFNELGICSVGWAHNTISNLNRISPEALQLPDSFYITEKDSKGKVYEKVLVFFSKQNAPLFLLYHGADLNADANTYNAKVQFGMVGVNITVATVLNGDNLAYYAGRDDGHDQWSGTVRYDTGETRTWTGKFVKAQQTQLELTRR